MAWPKILKKRLNFWFTNVMFALLPLGMSLLLRGLGHSLSYEEIAKSPEILFFAVMVSVTSFGDMTEKQELLDAVGFALLFKSSLQIGAVVSCILYGFLLRDIVPGPGSAEFRNNLLTLSLIIAGLLLVISTLAEFRIGRAEAADEQRAKAVHEQRAEAVNGEP
jgi:hypothetical protein